MLEKLSDGPRLHLLVCIDLLPGEQAAHLYMFLLNIKTYTLHLHVWSIVNIYQSLCLCSSPVCQCSEQRCIHLVTSNESFGNCKILGHHDFGDDMILYNYTYICYATCVTCMADGNEPAASQGQRSLPRCLKIRMVCHYFVRAFLCTCSNHFPGHTVYPRIRTATHQSSTPTLHTQLTVTCTR